MEDAKKAVHNDDITQIYFEYLLSKDHLFF